MVYQYVPFSSERVLMGTTPLLDIAPLVVTDVTFEDTPVHEAARTTLMINTVRVAIEADGYRQHEAVLRTGDTAPVEHRIVLDRVN